MNKNKIKNKNKNKNEIKNENKNKNENGITKKDELRPRTYTRT